MIIAKITRIENGIVYCKTVNPINKPNPFEFTFFDNDVLYKSQLGCWNEAESELKELPLDTFVSFNGSPDFMKAFIGDTIEVIEIDNKFKIA